MSTRWLMLGTAHEQRASKWPTWFRRMQHSTEFRVFTWTILHHQRKTSSKSILMYTFRMTVMKLFLGMPILHWFLQVWHIELQVPVRISDETEFHLQNVKTYYFESIPGVPEKAEQWIFSTLRVKSIISVYVIRSNIFRRREWYQDH